MVANNFLPEGSGDASYMAQSPIKMLTGHAVSAKHIRQIGAKVIVRAEGIVEKHPDKMEDRGLPGVMLASHSPISAPWRVDRTYSVYVPVLGRVVKTTDLVFLPCGVDSNYNDEVFAHFYDDDDHGDLVSAQSEPAPRAVRP